MFSNDYRVFPSSAVEGDTFQFNRRTYTYSATRDRWVSAGIEDITHAGPDITIAVIDRINSNTTVMSFRADIDMDDNWVLLLAKQKAELMLANTVGQHYTYIPGAESTDMLASIENYIQEVIWCLNVDHVDDVQWPLRPWPE